MTDSPLAPPFRANFWRGHIEADHNLPPQKRGGPIEMAKISINTGGVCDNCGEPRFAHAGQRCPTDAECDRLRPQLDEWRERVNPAKRVYGASRQRAKEWRNLQRKSQVSEREARLIGDAAALVEQAYQLAVQAADRAAECWQ